MEWIAPGQLMGGEARFVPKSPSPKGHALNHYTVRCHEPGLV